MNWYDKSGKNADVVISSRVRFARNIEGYPFEPRLSSEKAIEIIDKVKSVYTESEGYTFTNFSDITPNERSVASENYTVSPEFANKTTPHALFSNDKEGVYVMVCEEDHLRIQSIVPGLALDDAYKSAEKAETLADSALDLSYSEHLGYLTHCPTNLGTGMRASVMMFLPALTMHSQVRHLMNQLQQVGLTIRGADGEGSNSEGGLYQISNQVTLGLSEEEILEKLGAIVEQIIASERDLRRKMSENDGERIRDLTRRALGTALYAESIDSKEMIKLYTNIRLGVAMGCITETDFAVLDKMRIETQRASITEKYSIDQTDAVGRDRARAKHIRAALQR